MLSTHSNATPSSSARPLSHRHARAQAVAPKSISGRINVGQLKIKAWSSCRSSAADIGRQSAIFAFDHTQTLISIPRKSHSRCGTRHWYSSESQPSGSIFGRPVGYLLAKDETPLPCQPCRNALQGTASDTLTAYQTQELDLGC